MTQNTPRLRLRPLIKSFETPDFYQYTLVPLPKCISEA